MAMMALLVAHLPADPAMRFQTPVREKNLKLVELVNMRDFLSSCIFC